MRHAPPVLLGAPPVDQLQFAHANRVEVFELFGSTHELVPKEG